MRYGQMTGRSYDVCSVGATKSASCNVWALVCGLCNYLDDNGRTLLLQMVSDSGTRRSVCSASGLWALQLPR